MFLSGSPDAWDRLWEIPDEVVNSAPSAPKMTVVRRVAPAFSTDFLQPEHVRDVPTVNSPRVSRKAYVKAGNVAVESSLHTPGASATEHLHTHNIAPAHSLCVCKLRPQALTSFITTSQLTRSTHGIPERTASLSPRDSSGIATTTAHANDFGAEAVGLTLPRVSSPSEKSSESTQTQQCHSWSHFSGTVAAAPCATAACQEMTSTGSCIPSVAGCFVTEPGTISPSASTVYVSQTRTFVCTGDNKVSLRCGPHAVLAGMEADERLPSLPLLPYQRASDADPIRLLQVSVCPEQQQTPRKAAAEAVTAKRASGASAANAETSNLNFVPRNLVQESSGEMSASGMGCHNTVELLPDAAPVDGTVDIQKLGICALGPAASEAPATTSGMWSNTAISLSGWSSDPLQLVYHSHDPCIHYSRQSAGGLPPQELLHTEPEGSLRVVVESVVKRQLRAPGVMSIELPVVASSCTEAQTPVSANRPDAVPAAQPSERTATITTAAVDDDSTAKPLSSSQPLLQSPLHQQQGQQRLHTQLSTSAIPRGPKTTTARLLMRVRKHRTAPPGASATASAVHGASASGTALTSACLVGPEGRKVYESGEEAPGSESDSGLVGHAHLGRARPRKKPMVTSVVAAPGCWTATRSLVDEVKRALEMAVDTNTSHMGAGGLLTRRAAWRLAPLRGRFDFRPSRQRQQGLDAIGTALNAEASSSSWHGGDGTGSMTARKRRSNCSCDNSSGDVSAQQPTGLDSSNLSGGGGSCFLALLKSLDEWRTHRARSVGKTPESLLRRGLLEDIASRCPLSVLELEDVPGLPRPLVRRFGQEVLDVCRNHAHLRASRPLAATMKVRTRHTGAAAVEARERRDRSWAAVATDRPQCGVGMQPAPLAYRNEEDVHGRPLGASRDCGVAKRPRLSLEQMVAVSTADVVWKGWAGKAPQHKCLGEEEQRGAVTAGTVAEDGGGCGLNTPVTGHEVADGEDVSQRWGQPVGWTLQLEAVCSSRMRQQLLGILGMQARAKDGEVEAMKELLHRTAGLRSSQPPTTGRGVHQIGGGSSNGSGNHGGSLHVQDSVPCDVVRSHNVGTREQRSGDGTSAITNQGNIDMPHSQQRLSTVAAFVQLEAAAPAGATGPTQGCNQDSDMLAAIHEYESGVAGAEPQATPFDQSDVSALNEPSVTTTCTLGAGGSACQRVAGTISSPADDAAVVAADTGPQSAAAAIPEAMRGGTAPLGRAFGVKRGTSTKDGCAVRKSPVGHKCAHSNAPWKATAAVTTAATAANVPASWEALPEGCHARCGKRLASACTPSLHGAPLKCLLGILAETGTAAAPLLELEAGDAAGTDVASAAAVTSVTAGRLARGGGHVAAALAAAPVAVLPAAAVALATTAQDLGRAGGQEHIQRLRAMVEAVMPAWEVRRVLACMALSPAAQPQAVLRLKFGASRDSVRLAFRRLSLLVHPDKNRSLGAAEAFALVSSAASKLLGEARYQKGGLD